MEDGKGDDDSGDNQKRKRLKKQRYEIFNRTFLESRAGALSLTNQIPFPVKLFQMLEDLDETGYAHIASWSSDGKSLRVHDQKVFVDEVLPSYFRQSKYRSFQRQLYLYGFTRIVDGPDQGYYSHPEFQRSNKKQCEEILPRKRKGKAAVDGLEDSLSSQQPDTETHVHNPSSLDAKNGAATGINRDISSGKLPDGSAMSHGTSSDADAYSSNRLLLPHQEMHFPPEARLPTDQGGRAVPRNLIAGNSALQTQNVASQSHTMPNIAGNLSTMTNNNNPDDATKLIAASPILTQVTMPPIPTQDAMPSMLGSPQEQLIVLQQLHQLNASLIHALAASQQAYSSASQMQTVPSAADPRLSTIQHQLPLGSVNPGSLSQLAAGTTSSGSPFSPLNPLLFQISGQQVPRVNLKTTATAGSRDQEPTSRTPQERPPQDSSLSQNTQDVTYPFSSALLSSPLTNPDRHLSSPSSEDGKVAANDEPSTPRKDQQNGAGSGSSGEDTIDTRLFDDSPPSQSTSKHNKTT